MYSWEEIVEDIEKNASFIKKKTQALHTHFGVTYFTYHHVRSDGHYSVLLDRPDFAAHYVERKLYLQDPFLRHPRFFKTGLYSIREFVDVSLKQLIDQEYTDFFKNEPGLIYIQKTKEGVDFFGMSGNFDLFKLNYLDFSLMKQFCNYFKKETKPLLNKMQSEPIFLPKLKPGFNEGSKHLQLSKTHLQFLKEIGLNSLLQDFEKLSDREKESLSLVIEGKTAKESAMQLNLSSRTVEGYLDSAKTKLNAGSRGELFQKALLFHRLQLI